MRGKGALLALLLATVALTGCIGSEELDQAATTPSAPGPVEELIERTVSLIPDPGMGEPSLGVTSDGVLFTNGRDGAYRSTDGGQNWTALGDPTDPVPNFDPDLAVDKDGNVWFDVLYLACNAVSVSQDGGDTWSPVNPLACNGPGGDRQYVVPTEGCEAFLYYHQLPTFHQTAVRTTDCGTTWVPTGPVEFPDHHLALNEGSGWGGGGFWNEATDTVHFTFTWFMDGPAGPGGWAPATAASSDDGLTWEVRTPEPAQGESVGLSLVVGAADDAGNIYLAWAEARGSGDDMAVLYASSPDDGETWTEPVRIDDGQGSAVFPAITAGADGQIAIAYYEADEQAYPTELPDEAAWNVTLVTIENATSPTPMLERFTLSDQIVRHGPICPDGTSCMGDREFLDYFAIKTLPSGGIAAVYNSMLHGEEEGDLVNVFTQIDEPLLSHGGDQP